MRHTSIIPYLHYARHVSVRWSVWCLLTAAQTRIIISITDRAAPALLPGFWVRAPSLLAFAAA